MPAQAANVGEIDVECHAAHRPALGDARPAHRERHADILLIGSVLALEHPVLAEMKAVVGRVDEVAALELARVLERVDQGRDQLVDRLQALQALAMAGRDLGDRIFVQAWSGPHVSIVGDELLAASACAARHQRR
jgi:hypothetical protein